ncbi:MAG: leucine-rich repeat domain-containing protein [Defluviitaleaceae bacterium]|nr:leucine-rich repeat domain-containing protein [Defluviitaleaceae bacterium]
MKKFIAVLMAMVMALFVTTPMLTAPSRWAAEAVEEAISLGLVPANLQSDFGRATTRAEFAALGVTLYEHFMGPITGRVSFIDTEDTAVEKAAYIGIVSGVGVGRFNPDGELTREQAGLLVFRLLEVMWHPVRPADIIFADRRDIASWARYEVGGVVWAGIMEGVGNRMFSPQGAFTREQSIVTMMRLYQRIYEGRERGDVEVFLIDQEITGSELNAMFESGRIPLGTTRLVLRNTNIADISSISNLTSITYLSLDNNPIQDISALANLTSLTSLHISNSLVQDISPLSNLTSLTSLSLSSIPVRDISPLANLAGLTTLSLSGSTIRDISPLADLTGLKSLSLFDSSVQDISPINNLTGLEWLSIGHSLIIDLSALDNLPYLTDLSLHWNPYFSGDIAALRNLPNLTRLRIDCTGGQNRITDFSPIGVLYNLRYLELLQASHFRDLSILNNLPNLVNLQLNFADIQDFSPLSRHTNLYRLALIDTQISDLSVLPLQSLPNLTRLFLNRNEISDVSPLGELTTLRSLSLSDNMISDITPLAALYNLEWAEIRRNPLTRDQLNELQAALPDLQLQR